MVCSRKRRGIENDKFHAVNNRDRPEKKCATGKKKLIYLSCILLTKTSEIELGTKKGKAS
jgi:hypothetical protein